MRLAVIKKKVKMQLYLDDEVLGQNCRVGKIYPAKKCGEKLCNPQSEFDMVESCKECKKWQ